MEFIECYLDFITIGNANLPNAVHVGTITLWEAWSAKGILHVHHFSATFYKTSWQFTWRLERRYSFGTWSLRNFSLFWLMLLQEHHEIITVSLQCNTFLSICVKCFKTLHTEKGVTRSHTIRFKSNCKSFLNVIVVARHKLWMQSDVDAFSQHSDWIRFLITA